MVLIVGARIFSSETVERLDDVLQPERNILFLDLRRLFIDISNIPGWIRSVALWRIVWINNLNCDFEFHNLFGSFVSQARYSLSEIFRKTNLQPSFFADAHHVA